METKSNYNAEANERSKRYLQNNAEARARKQRSNRRSTAKRFILNDAEKNELLELNLMIEERLKNG